MRKWIALGCAVLLVVCWAWDTYATAVGPFPGLDSLIAEADAIVILRVEKNLQPELNGVTPNSYSCFIYQTLKGEIAANQCLTINLYDTRFSCFVEPFPAGSTHLMFLRRQYHMQNSACYTTLLRQGSTVRIDPIGNEKKPEGKTLKDQIIRILKHTMAYNEKRYKNEQNFLQNMIDGKMIDDM